LAAPSSVAAIPSGSFGSEVDAVGMQLALPVCAVLALDEPAVVDDEELLLLPELEPLELPVSAPPHAASSMAATTAAVQAPRPRLETMTISSTPGIDDRVAASQLAVTRHAERETGSTRRT
jgi:hypothetical protein